METGTKIKLAARFFQEDANIIFAYVFGSAAHGKAGPMSDLDFAVCLEGVRDLFAYRLRLMEVLATALKTEAFDLVVLNNAPLLLRYEVVKGGELIKDNASARVAFETATIREFLDTSYIRAVQRRAMKEKIAKGGYFG